MLPNSSASLPLSLSLDEDNNENKDLQEFYQSNLSSFLKCPWNLIPYKLIRKIAVKIDETLPNREEWRLYATSMKIDNDTISYINVTAHCRQDQPIFIAMDKILRQRGSFGHIIQALLENDRFDVLREIAPFAKSLLLKLPQRQINNSTSINCKNENDDEEKCTFKTFSAEQECENDDFQQHSINEPFKNILKISEPSKLPDESSEEIKSPTAPEEEKIKVLIQHSESENSIAEHLSSEFSKEGVIAMTLTEVNNLTLFEPVNVLETVFREVDFIVPVLSNSFIEEINPKNLDSYLESIYAQNNRQLYDLIMLEYQTNRCVNFRVRPVIVEEMSRKLIRYPIFRFSFRLPKEFPKLIKVLKETKERTRHLI